LSIRRRPPLGLEEQARIKNGYDMMVRICIIGFGLMIAAILPVPWGWKIVPFLAIMFLVGIVLPVVGRARRNRI
jgi:hypothetical protein